MDVCEIQIRGVLLKKTQAYTKASTTNAGSDPNKSQVGLLDLVNGG